MASIARLQLLGPNLWHQQYKFASPTGASLQMFPEFFQCIEVYSSICTYLILGVVITIFVFFFLEQPSGYLSGYMFLLVLVISEYLFSVVATSAQSSANSIFVFLGSSGLKTPSYKMFQSTGAKIESCVSLAFILYQVIVPL